MMGGVDWLCGHWETTEPDEDGKALCVRCGAALQVVLTEASLIETFEAVWRDYGRSGRHKRECVRLEDGGWCCAADCPLARPPEPLSDVYP